LIANSGAALSRHRAGAAVREPGISYGGGGFGGIGLIVLIILLDTRRYDGRRH
jgi:hypothetical protein